MEIKAKCPASCGELLQGWIEGSEKLISYPINWFSEVTLSDRLIVNKTGNTKAWLAFQQTCEYFGVPENERPPVSLQVKSTIPVAKGMASSTADIAATIGVTANWLQQTITEAEIAKLCLQLEPTDSTIFQTLTLFDHLKGATIRSTEWLPKLGVVVLEPLTIIETAIFRQESHQNQLLQNEASLARGFALFEQANRQQKVDLLGVAATISAECNQAILPKPFFKEMLEVVEKLDLPGLNVSHSGTVVGLLYEQQKIDPLEILFELERRYVTTFYSRYYFREWTTGGVQIIS
ncbi:propanediol utilization protein [Listeria ivanovii]|uniref:Putative propanediol utilization protein PduX n=1 Tax=Listeria ivanovii (strain ATCC BAA-678 / PAM 55) TaxID=881621 RepID=G2ZES3_LISIP|nr:propanediol utilization protein PduX [Listeria ivanovii]AHI55649.1 propanediol utilization protein PduX [Listeria ivanovii WSLC3009]AIS65102.1 propanediol utilization protein [Listeria ivanovii subsp. ivanovii]MBC1758174.1 propanediol utilization protein [Listeria ivanovii]MBK3913051.1 propanediol utilization protein [Listeria ivanovii subsp. ivanovii]MBK3920832.1 propanediol utilization protein [Listeria ivanovii subsp. ivanovii]